MSKTINPRPIRQDERRVANIYETEFAAFAGDDTVGRGESYLSLDSTAPAGVGFHVYKMAPGTTTTPHEHTADEHFLVLEGDITDNDGYRYRPGDLVLLKKGTEHYSSTDRGCTLAVFIGTKEKNLEPVPSS